MRIEELRTPLVAPSILARKGEGLLPAALSLKGQGIEVLHFDFMRPPYVDGEGLSFEDFSLIHGRTCLFEDVHVMSGTPLEDGKFFLGALRCVGACSLAPVVMVNDKVYGNMTAEKVADILKECAE